MQQDLMPDRIQQNMVSDKMKQSRIVMHYNLFGEEMARPKLFVFFFSGECTSSKYDLVYSKEVLRNENDENRAKKLVRDIDKKWKLLEEVKAWA